MNDYFPLPPPASQPLKPRQEFTEAETRVMNPLLKLTDGLAAVCQCGAEGSEVVGAQAGAADLDPSLRRWWHYASMVIGDISRGWMWLEQDESCGLDEWCVYEHAMDESGNDEPPTKLGAFHAPLDAVSFVEDRWRRVYFGLV